MRIITLVVLFGIVNTANASFFSSKKPAFDKEGNCVPELIAEHTRLYSEVEALDQIATRCETQSKNNDKESQKLAVEGFKELGTKAKVTLKAIKLFNKTYRDAACKAQVAKHGKKEVIAFNVNEKAASLEKLAAGYQEFSEKSLKAGLAKK